jgi:fucose 4-O-acetylase-like acetyltransferase
MTDTEQRREWVDISRGIGIVLVVVGHTLRGLVSSSVMINSTGMRFVDGWIYAFHMPLFFFLAGVFLPRSAQQPFGRFATRQFERLGYPYLLWGTLQSVLQILSSRYTNHAATASELWKIVYSPPMQFWFLYVLFLSNALFVALWKRRVTRLGILILAIFAFAVPSIISLGPWGVVYQICDNFIYIALGVALGPALLTALVSNPLKSYQSSLAPGERPSPLPTPRVVAGREAVRRIRIRAGCLLFSIFGYGIVSLYIYRPPMAAGQYFFKVSAAVVAYIGIGATISLSIALATFRIGPMMQYLGERTLPIFVAHTLASAAFRIGLDKILGITDPTIHLLGGIVVGIGVPLILVRLSETSSLPYLFQLPISQARRYLIQLPISQARR